MATDAEIRALVEKAEKWVKKLDRMKKEYRAAKDAAIKNYRKVGFLEDRCKAYEEQWSTMPANYEAAMTAEKFDKWKANWVRKMFGADVAKRLGYIS